ncbi:hypothetical protein X927_06910 [Petrotoga mexicana DSM 14811]|uniref:Uncharacterized protein n=1 Tax=Petrotoga mexicana DSM 14811 TaxID=1122954 RepID=A0A2K1P7V7_9BACT|nr:hypothetical protein [Petrotoga mexicana]PNR98895.1 hypothetical protein X927_06910 [Petrotoga mexicana DSM 14811]
MVNQGISKPLTLSLNKDIIIRLNYSVDFEGLEPEIFTRKYLKGLNLIE